MALSNWTPNALSFEVEVPSPTVMVVNQNYEPGWRLVKGRGDVFSRDGLIGVLLPAGRQQLEPRLLQPCFRGRGCDYNVDLRGDVRGLAL